MTTANQDQTDHWNNSDDVGHSVAEQARHDGMLAPFTGIIQRTRARSRDLAIRARTSPS